MLLPNPRNVQQARRQIRVNGRAKSLFANGTYYWYDCGNGVYGVAKRSGSDKPDTAYTVTLLPVSCSCPDFQEHRDYCKHVLALADALEAEAEEAQCREHDEEEDGRQYTEACAIDGELRGSCGVEF
jgi:hypothetical protein